MRERTGTVRGYALGGATYFGPMSFRAKLKRYLLILEKLPQRPSLAELAGHLADHGLDSSLRTLQRDLEQVRDELGVEVDYDRPANQYFIARKGPYHDTVLQLLERAQLLELVDGDTRNLRELGDRVEFEGLGCLHGIKHLAPLLRAIRERRAVAIHYRRYQTEALRIHQMSPHLLKEYRGRWYVLGIAKGYAAPIALGLDRIEQLEMKAERFAAGKVDGVRRHYAPVIGVDASPGTVERVVLRFTPLQGRYVKALPVHPSQQVLRDDAEACDIALDVLPNYELRQWVLSQGSTVKVLKPASLAAELCAELKAALEGYAPARRKKA